MFDYVTEELPGLLESQFSIGKENLRSISGHSMVRKFLCMRLDIQIPFAHNCGL